MNRDREACKALGTSRPEYVEPVHVPVNVIVHQRHIDVTLPEWLTGSPAKSHMTLHSAVGLCPRVFESLR